jgi:phosphoribosylformylglycinamidine synthase subunit PurQ / glutaminase
MKMPLVRFDAIPQPISVNRLNGSAVGSRNAIGAVNDIAGIYSKDLNVLGLMPHPENLIDPLVGGTDGRGLFESLVGEAKVA